MRVATVLLVLTGCDDTWFPSGGGTDTAVTDDWCGVRTLIGTECASCHSASGHAGGLDLETDAHAALVGVASTTDPSLTLVVPGDPDASFLVAKLVGDLPAEQGMQMPPTGPLPSATIDAVRGWIAAGATSECSDTDIIVPGDYHPQGWEDPSQHGMAFKTHDTANGRDGTDADCRTCHGDALDGGIAGISCDGCHAGDTPAAWRTNCTFCHGGDETDGGAPPEDIDDSVQNLSFPAHTSHVTQPASDTHLPYDCTTCHTKPSDVENILAAGHIFDDTTDAEAEVVFTAGLSDRGVWDGATTCSNLYCHGNGQGDNGTYHATDATPTCGTCHAWSSSSESALERMSGEHHTHVWDENATCDTCHAATIAGSAIIDPTKHVNGVKDVLVSDGGTVVYSNGTCTGICHFEAHNHRSWTGN